MLVINVAVVEEYDEANKKFLYEYFELELEHSLVSLSKWESKHKKPFLSKDSKSDEEMLDYIKCMTLNDEVPPEVWGKLSRENLREINDHIADEKTATWFNERGPQKPSTEVITSELIYYWMAAFQIDWQAQYWHLSRLLTLVRVANHKNQPQKKMSRREVMQQHRDLNAQRRAARSQS